MHFSTPTPTLPITPIATPTTTLSSSLAPTPPLSQDQFATCEPSPTTAESSQDTGEDLLALYTRKKGKNFGPDEDFNLAAAWLEVSQDPIIGGDQKKDTFWAKVHADFLKRMKRTESDVKEDSRAATRLKTRWRTLQATCSKFAGCYAAIVARNESGKTLEDQVREAHVLYREQNGGPFRSEGVWSVLRHAPKWIATLGLKRKCLKRTNVDANCGDTDADEGETNLQRPVGRKTAKKTLMVEHSLMSIVSKLAEETEVKNPLLKEATSELIMARNLEGMTSTQRRYYELKQEQILADLQNELAKIQ